MNKTFKTNPDEIILNMHCYAGHGMSRSGRQILLVNEYSDIDKFYKFIAVEEVMRNFANFYR